MESMIKILSLCLKDSNLETISKAELRKKYLERTGLTKIPKEEKELFSTAVNTAYLNFLSNGTEAVNDTKIEDTSDNEVEENKDDGEFVSDSSSDDDIVPESSKDDINADQFRNGINYVQMEASSDSDEKSLASYQNGFKKQREKRKIASSSEDEIIQIQPTKRNKILKKPRKCSDSEADETEKTSKVKKHLKKPIVESSDSEDEPLTIFQKKSSSNGSLNAVDKSDESDDECLAKYSKKKLSNPLDSKNEPVILAAEKKRNSINTSKNNSTDSEDEPLTEYQKSNDFNHLKSKRLKMKLKPKSSRSDESTKSKKDSSDSEDESLSKYVKHNGSINSGKNSNSFTEENLNSSIKTFMAVENASDSEDELAPTKKKSNLLNGSRFSKYSSSESEDEPLTKYSRKKVNNSIESDEESVSTLTQESNSKNGLLQSMNNFSDSEDEPLNKLSDKKSGNSSDSKSGSTKKNVKEVNHSLKKSVTNGNQSEEKTLKKREKVRGFVDSDDDDISNQKKEKSSDGLKNSLLSDSSEDEPLSNVAKTFSDSEDEPLNKLSNKTDNTSNFKKECDKKFIKREQKHASKKSSSKSKGQTLNKKKKRFVDSDDDEISENQETIKFFAKQKNSVLSDSSEDEPLSNLEKEETKNSRDSEDKQPNKLSNKTNNSSDIDKELDKVIKEDLKPILKKASYSEPEEQTLNMKNIRDADLGNDENTTNEPIEESLGRQRESLLSDSSEDEPLSNSTKSEAKNSSSSEDEPLNKSSIKKASKKRKVSESGSSSCVDENEEHSSKTDKASMKKQTRDSGKGKKRPSASENKIEHLKKYVRVAGIRIQNYNKLFENCKTMKAKCEKLMSLLEKEGLKGRPTLEKCKKLKKKIETKREIAELDLSNILKVEGGRPKRSVCSDTTNHKPEKRNSTPIKKFSRLQDVFDSEESD